MDWSSTYTATQDKRFIDFLLGETVRTKKYKVFWNGIFTDLGTAPETKGEVGK